MIDLLTAQANIKTLILQVEKKYSGSEIPKSTATVLNTLKSVLTGMESTEEFINKLEIDCEVAIRSHKYTSLKYCKMALLNTKCMATIRKLEEKNTELLKGLEN